MTNTIRFLQDSDREAWEPLWSAYQVFYEADIPRETTNITWERFHDPSELLYALGSFDESNKLVGIAHVIFHRSTWSAKNSCYLNDLYVENDQRGKGTGSALIERVAEFAREKDAGKLYWMTHETNKTAQSVYDKVGFKSGFIQYKKTL